MLARTKTKTIIWFLISLFDNPRQNTIVLRWFIITARLSLVKHDGKKALPTDQATELQNNSKNYTLQVPLWTFSGAFTRCFTAIWCHRPLRSRMRCIPDASNASKGGLSWVLLKTVELSLFALVWIMLQGLHFFIFLYSSFHPLTPSSPQILRSFLKMWL